MNIYKHKQHGFTLLEVMVVIVIVAVLVTIGAPELQKYLINNQMTAKTNSMVAALNLARGESITRSSLGLARVTAGQLTNNSGTWTTSGGWNSGWVVWRDKNGDNLINRDDASTTDANEEEVLRAVEGSPTVIFTMTLESDGSSVDGIEYSGNGQAQAFSGSTRKPKETVNITLCNPKTAYGRHLTILRTGRVNLEDARYKGC